MGEIFCGKCNLDIPAGKQHTKMRNKHYHLECAVCECGKPLNHFTEIHGKFYCHNCVPQYNKDHDICHRCKQGVAGEFKAVADKKFHPDCLSCLVCKTPAGTGEYVFILNEVYCAQCAANVKKTVIPPKEEPQPKLPPPEPLSSQVSTNRTASEMTELKGHMVKIGQVPKPDFDPEVTFQMVPKSKPDKTRSSKSTSTLPAPPGSLSLSHAHTSSGSTTMPAPPGSLSLSHSHTGPSISPSSRGSLSASSTGRSGR